MRRSSLAAIDRTEFVETEDWVDDVTFFVCRFSVGGVAPFFPIDEERVSLLIEVCGQSVPLALTVFFCSDSVFRTGIGRKNRTGRVRRRGGTQVVWGSADVSKRMAGNRSVENLCRTARTKNLRAVFKLPTQQWV